MFEHLGDGQPVINITIEHRADEVNAVFGEGEEGDSEGVVEDLVDVIEGVFLVDDRVKEDTQGPDVLFFATIGSALEDFGRGVI